MNISVPPSPGSRRSLAARALLLAGLLFAGLALPVTAQVFADPADPAFAEPIPPPPSDDSPAGRADLETVWQVQLDRTPQQVARAVRVGPHTPFLMGSAVMGPWFNAENLPRTAAIMQAVWRQSNAVTGGFKRHWSRQRPPQRDARIQPCVAVPADASYPSGHAANAAVWAAVFSAAFPEHAAQFEAQVVETMWARILGGAHYPTDTQAGRMLGERIARVMLASAPMAGALEEIRSEVAACRSRQLKEGR